MAVWAEEHGFRLSPDAPEVLDFYTARSPIFLAAVFDGAAAAERGQQIGDGTPVHITIPTSNPWVPLRILGLGKQANDRIDADVFLLTDDKPALLPQPGAKMALAYSQAASQTLLTDLRSDQNSAWVPESAWLTKLAIDSGLYFIETERLAEKATVVGKCRPLEDPHTAEQAWARDGFTR